MTPISNEDFADEITPISNENFADFLKEYTENPKYYETITEISWPKNKNGETDRTKDPLIDNRFFSLHSSQNSQTLRVRSIAISHS